MKSTHSSKSILAAAVAIATSCNNANAFLHNHRHVTITAPTSTTHLFYNPPDKSSSGDRAGREFPDNVVWQSLSDTERWIEQTLNSSGSNSNVEDEAKGIGKTNPYARKEVSYVCETTEEPTEYVARLFSRLREVRELGESHGKNEVRLAEVQGSKYKPGTFRQTLVVVAPSIGVFDQFEDFDAIVNAINKARRSAGDYVLSTKNKEEEDSSKKWITAINMAHLHPRFGGLNADNEDDVVDPNEDPKITEYKKKRKEARRSPYPTCVVEVRATPPFEMQERSSALDRKKKVSIDDVNSGTSESSVSKKDLDKLEALFGMTVTTKDSTKANTEEDFYKAIGKTEGIEAFTFITPQDKARQWILDNVANPSQVESTFSFSDAVHVDEAYEYVFTSIAMDFHGFAMNESGSENKKRTYLMMPDFLSTSATSLEKFAASTMNIVKAVPALKDRVDVTTYHKEHVDTERRSPLPILRVEWL